MEFFEELKKLKQVTPLKLKLEEDLPELKVGSQKSEEKNKTTIDTKSIKATEKEKTEQIKPENGEED